MTDAEVKLYRAVELDGVRIRGKNCPKPVKNWAQTGVSFKVLSVLKGMLHQKCQRIFSLRNSRIVETVF